MNRLAVMSAILCLCYFSYASLSIFQEIFLRELISNSSDALDKIKFESLKNKDKNLLESNPEFYVHIIPDKTNNTLTIIDSGIGE